MEQFLALEANGELDHAEARGDKLAAPVRQLVQLWRQVQQARIAQDPRALLTVLQQICSIRPGSAGSAKNWPGVCPKPAVKDLRSWCQALPSWIEKTDPALGEQAGQLLGPLRKCLRYALARYRAAKDEANVLDFDDLESGALELFEDHRHVRALWQSQIDALLVDEFQDTNGRQRDLIVWLNGRSGEGDSTGKLFIVGDGKQSIYRFRGADVAVFRQEQRAIAQRGGQVCALSASYRAHRPLVEALNDLMGRVLPAPSPDLADYEAPFERLEAERQQTASGLREPFVECHLALGSKANGALADAANGLVSRLIQLVEEGGIKLQDDGQQRPLDYGDVAILCRRSAAFAVYEDALERAGVPYVTVAGRGFYERPEVRDLVNLLRALDDPDDDLALVGALRSPAFAVTDLGLYHLCSIQQDREKEQGIKPRLWEIAIDNAAAERLDLRDQERVARAVDVISGLCELAGRAPVATVLRRLLEETHYRAIAIKAGQRRALRNIDKLLSDAYRSGLVGLGTFLEYIQGLRDVGTREGEARSLAEGSVQIMSIHAAKGLEFPIVALGDLAATPRATQPELLLDQEFGPILKLAKDECLPLIYRIALARQAQRDQAEDKRLLYVAATRVREVLLLSGNLGISSKGAITARGGGWLAIIAEEMLAIKGEPAPILEAGSPPICWPRTMGQTPVSCTFYPPEFKAVPRTSEETPPAMSPGRSTLLLQPVQPSAIKPEQAEAPDAKRDSRAIYRVVQASGHYPARILGDVVHAALAQWRFAEADFYAWAQTVAESSGLTDRAAIYKVVRRAESILNRFQDHSLCQEMERAARRLHEVPYSVPWDDEPHDGRIDALYQDREGRWHIVEFKTDYTKSAETVRSILASADNDYIAQIQDYRRAAEQWLGQPVDTCLVFLNCQRGIEIVPIA